ncbi:MAG: nuclear transport factor 2 family protein [Acidobacteriia bacterium]|nr:nuclear transport factor 2 family protein [Terriglobia bacterium]
MKTRLLLFVFFLLVVPSFAQSSAAGSQAIASDSQRLTPFAQTLLDTEHAFIAAHERGDRQYLKNTVADDFVGVDNNGNSSGKADMLEDVEPAKPASDKQRPILYFFEVVPLNEGAAVVTYDAVRPGERPRYVHVSDTWVKQGEQWKLKFQQETPNLWSALDTD